MCPGRLAGCSRGVYGLASWEISPLNTQTNGAEATPPEPRSESSVTKKRIVAKYMYHVNPDSPLGTELPLAQQQRLWFIEEHSDNTLWWLAEDEEGNRGYIPKNYVMVLEDPAGGLPWLQKRSPEVSSPAETTSSAFGKPVKLPVKPYISSYSHADLEKPQKKSQFVCDVCEKDFNGPQPYQAHMSSKAHRETLHYLSQQ